MFKNRRKKYTTFLQTNFSLLNFLLVELMKGRKHMTFEGEEFVVCLHAKTAPNTVESTPEKTFLTVK